MKPKMIPSDEEVRKFFYALPDDRAKALYLCYVSSGKRKMETLSLRWSELNLLTGMILRENSRGGRTKHEWVSFVNPEALEYVKRYLARRNDDDPSSSRLLGSLQSALEGWLCSYGHQDNSSSAALLVRR
ncbi:site-specific integrase [Candidatus Bathyarchaeota archaeon]|nr:site-specific integrase [Candidatus Bathyarchaeota archaeon]MBS7628211.1 site-specific integrase [Candidatus Bathyarchaeota archaeon]